MAIADQHELLAELEHCSASEHRPITVHRWLRQRRREAFSLHREALIAP
ncbi:hypothetical protein [Actinacidiphila oryziradicis]|nr:hypothetical protein [Actinacidiphila oryziradicis]MCW2873193.1 hypothetical protein [Actinacidiphila oryziradicis]